MIDRAFEHVGDGFNAAMRMRRKAAAGAFKRIVEGKMVKEQKGIVFVALAWGDGALQ